MGTANAAEPRRRLSEDEEVNRNWPLQFVFDRNGQRVYEPPEVPHPRPELCRHCGNWH